MEYTVAEIEKMRTIVKKHDDKVNDALRERMVEFWTFINEWSEDGTIQNGVHYLDQQCNIPGLVNRRQISIPLALLYNIYASAVRFKGIKPMTVQELTKGFELSPLYIGKHSAIRVNGRAHACHQFLTEPEK